MKHLIKAYISATLDDKIKLLASKHNISISSLISELLNQAINRNESLESDVSAKIVEEQLYLQHFILITILSMNTHLDSERYTVLKADARAWAKKRIGEINNA